MLNGQKPPSIEFSKFTQEFSSGRCYSSNLTTSVRNDLFLTMFTKLRWAVWPHVCGKRAPLFPSTLWSVWTTNFCPVKYTYNSFYDNYQIADPKRFTTTGKLKGGKKKWHLLMLEQWYLLWLGNVLLLMQSILSVDWCQSQCFSKPMKCIWNFNGQASINEPKMPKTQNVALGM